MNKPHPRRENPGELQQAVEAIWRGVDSRDGLTVVLAGSVAIRRRLCVNFIESAEVAGVLSIIVTSPTGDPLEPIARALSCERSCEQLEAIAAALAALAAEDQVAILLINQAEELDVAWIAALDRLLRHEDPCGKFLQVVLFGTGGLQRTILHPDILSLPYRRLHEIAFGSPSIATDAALSVSPLPIPDRREGTPSGEKDAFTRLWDAIEADTLLTVLTSRSVPDLTRVTVRFLDHAADCGFRVVLATRPEGDPLALMASAQDASRRSLDPEQNDGTDVSTTPTRGAILLVNRAHLLDARWCRFLRDLLTPGDGDGKRIQVVLAGEPELRAILPTIMLPDEALFRVCEIDLDPAETLAMDAPQHGAVVTPADQAFPNSASSLTAASRTLLPRRSVLPAGEKSAGRPARRNGRAIAVASIGAVAVVAIAFLPVVAPDFGRRLFGTRVGSRVAALQDGKAAPAIAGGSAPRDDIGRPGEEAGHVLARSDAPPSTAAPAVPSPDLNTGSKQAMEGTNVLSHPAPEAAPPQSAPEPSLAAEAKPQSPASAPPDEMSAPSALGAAALAALPSPAVSPQGNAPTDDDAGPAVVQTQPGVVTATSEPEAKAPSAPSESAGPVPTADPGTPERQQALANPPEGNDPFRTGPAPDARSPARPGAPGLVLIAQPGDTLPALYKRVYRGVGAPPYARILAINPAPLRPGMLVLLPAPVTEERPGP